MQKLLASALVIAFMFVSALPSPAQTASKKPAAAKKAKKDYSKEGPFHGKVKTFNAAEKSMVIGKRTFYVTDTTKIINGDAPAKLADVKEGDTVGGYFKDNNGKLEVEKLNLGDRPTKK